MESGVRVVHDCAGFAQIITNLGLSLQTQWQAPPMHRHSAMIVRLQADGVQTVHVLSEPGQPGLRADQQRGLCADIHFLRQAGLLFGVPCRRILFDILGQSVISHL